MKSSRGISYFSKTKIESLISGTSFTIDIALVLIGVMVGESCSWTGVAVRLEGSWIVVLVKRERLIGGLVALAKVGLGGG